MQRFKTFLAAIAIVTILAEPSACFAAAAPEDTRLDRKVTLALKATALSDLCDQLQGETGIAFVAGRSVADEKVTLLCKEMPLREVMRQLARPFGYTWVRGGKEREYRYTLEQDLRSQLIEEETRRRDRNAALLALDQEMSQYRPYLDLSPDEALARAAKASPEEKQRLQRLAGTAWGGDPDVLPSLAGGHGGAAGRADGDVQHRS